MKKKNKFLKIVLVIVGVLLYTGKGWSQFPGGPYLGQQLPGPDPELFAPGLLPELTSEITFTPDGLECFSTRWYPQMGSILMTTREQGGNWPEFDTVPFSVDYDQGPCLTPDGNRLYFICFKPLPPSPYYIRHLWYTDRVDSGWSEPVVMDSPIKEHYVISASASSNGNLYLAIDDNNDPGIFVSKLVNGNYQEPEKLSDSINYLNRPLRPFIAPDESYILFDAGETPDPISQRDIYISYRNADETWSKAVALDETVNTSEWEVPVFVSDTNHLIFFVRETDTYWMDASSILTGTHDYPATGKMPQLYQNFPNPVTSVTSIRYTLPQHALVTLNVYNSLNQDVGMFLNEEKPAGTHIVSLDATDLPDGIYIYQLRADNVYLSGKMIVRK